MQILTIWHGRKTSFMVPLPQQNPCWVMTVNQLKELVPGGRSILGQWSVLTPFLSLTEYLQVTIVKVTWSELTIDAVCFRGDLLMSLIDLKASYVLGAYYIGGTHNIFIIVTLAGSIICIFSCVMCSWADARLHVAISYEAATSLKFTGYTDPGRGDMRVVYLHEGSIEAHIVLAFTRWTVVGRYIIIYIPSSMDHTVLEICEVEVFGFQGTFTCLCLCVYVFYYYTDCQYMQFSHFDKANMTHVQVLIWHIYNQHTRALFTLWDGDQTWQLMGYTRWSSMSRHALIQFTRTWRGGQLISDRAASLSRWYLSTEEMVEYLYVSDWY